MKKVLNTMIFTFILIFSFNTPCFSADNLTNYNIKVSFDPASEILIGNETVKYTNNTGTDLSKIEFHLYPDSYNSAALMPSIGSSSGVELMDKQKGDITITDLSAEGKRISSYSQDNQLLIVPLEVPLKSGSSIDISMSFSLKIPEGTNRLSYFNEVYSFTNWYPIVSEYNTSSGKWDENLYNPIGESNYSSSSDYTVTIDLPSGFKTAATGTEENISNSSARTVVTFKADNVRDFVFMTSPLFEKVSGSVNGINVNSFYIKERSGLSGKKTAEDMLSYTKQALSFYGKSFGEYPYKELDVVETYLTGGAMEYPQLIQLGRYPDDHSDAQQGLDESNEEMVVHETGHQWWYVTVGNNEFKEPLMDEALTTFSTAYFFEKEYGKYDDRSTASSIRNYPFGASRVSLSSGVDSFKDWGEYNNVIYRKGSQCFEDIREKVGDKLFLKTLKNYFTKYKFKNGSIKDFSEVLGSTAGSKIENYFIKCVSSPSYSTASIALKRNEIQEQRVYDLKDQLSSVKDYTIQKAVLSAASSGKLLIVVPDRISSTEKIKINSYIKKISADFSSLYGTKVSVISENKLSKSANKENLLILGDIKTVSLADKYAALRHIKLSSNKVAIGSKIYNIKHPSILFTIKNPNDKNSTIIVNLWTENFVNFDFLYDNNSQYIINSPDDTSIRGNL